MNNQRIEYLDVARGIGMLLVIAGHTIGGLGRDIIFSFHMPLFFILSGITFRIPQNLKEYITMTKKNVLSLLAPTLCVFFVNIISSIVKGGMDSNIYFWKSKVLSLIWGAGTDLTIGNRIIPALGITWFLIVLFWTKEIFGAFSIMISQKSFLWLSFVLFTVGGICGKYFYLPLSFDISLCALPMILLGAYLISDREPSLFYIVGGLIWLLCFVLYRLFGFASMDMADRNYPLFPVSFIGACGASICFIYVCYLTNRIRIFSRCFGFIGRNSLLLLIAHAIDFYLPNIWQITEHSYLNVLVRVLEDFVLFLALYCMKKRILKR